MAIFLNIETIVVAQAQKGVEKSASSECVCACININSSTNLTHVRKITLPLPVSVQFCNIYVYIYTHTLLCEPDFPSDQATLLPTLPSLLFICVIICPSVVADSVVLSLFLSLLQNFKISNSSSVLLCCKVVFLLL